jgi:RNA polymerase-associated protein LEO1
MRQLPDGTEVRESNARFVRWEDGSLQLFLGKEVLDVAEQDNSQNNNYLFAHTKGIIQVRKAGG